MFVGFLLSVPAFRVQHLALLLVLLTVLAWVRAPELLHAAIRRTWILLVSVGVFFGASPDFFGETGSGGEGFSPGVEQAARLLVCLVSMVLLNDRLGRDGVVSALYALVMPLQVLGIHAERGVVRLGLVLSELEGAQAAATRGQATMAAGQDYSQGYAKVKICTGNWGLSDGVALALAGLSLIAVYQQA